MNKSDQHTRALIFKSEIDPHHRVPLHVGLLTLERSKTVDEEISAKVIDFLDRNDPKKTNKPFFVLGATLVRDLCGRPTAG